MNYTNEQIRRQDRLLEKEKAISLLKNGEYGVLSMQKMKKTARMEFLLIMYGTRKIPFTFTVLPKDENYIVSNAATPFLSVL